MAGKSVVDVEDILCLAREFARFEGPDTANASNGGPAAVDRAARAYAALLAAGVGSEGRMTKSDVVAWVDREQQKVASGQTTAQLLKRTFRGTNRFSRSIKYQQLEEIDTLRSRHETLVKLRAILLGLQPVVEVVGAEGDARGDLLGAETDRRSFEEKFGIPEFPEGSPRNGWRS
jgi:hypothetical protein